MHKKTEQFHQTDSSFNFISIILVYPYNSITFRHDYFPNDLFGDIMR